MNHPESANGKIDKIVESTSCLCHSPKYAGKPFCLGCSSRLKEEKSKVYYNLFKSGEIFYEAFEEAKEYLKEVGEIR